jgi:hypothetical protein
MSMIPQAAMFFTFNAVTETNERTRVRVSV